MMILALAALLLEIPDSQLIAEQGGRDIFPPAFQGRWAPSLAECRDTSGLRISAQRVTGYESDAILLKNSGVIPHSGPNGQPAYTINALVAQSGNGEVGIATLRFTRVGDLLYTSEAGAEGEDEQWSNPNVRCPETRAAH